MAAAPAANRLAFLDVARGLAALCVLAQHGIEACLPGVARHLGPGFLGRTGVILFLLISGFIIPASLAQGGSQARFWLRRFFRLFPAYWLSVALAYVFWCFSGRPGPSAPPMETTGDWLLNLTMLQGFLRRPDAWGVFWTLRLELAVYATFSVLFATGLARRPGLVAAVALAAYALVGMGRPLLQGMPFDVGGQRLLYFAPMLGWVAQRYSSGETGRRTFLAVTIGQPLLLLAVWGVNRAVFPEETTSAFLHEWPATWGGAFACFFLLLSARRQAMPYLGGRLGRVSYSIYLLHPLVLVVMAPLALPAWAFLPSLLASTLVLAELAYRWVETPGIAVGRLLERHWWPIREAAASPVFQRRAA